MFCISVVLNLVVDVKFLYCLPLLVLAGCQQPAQEVAVVPTPAPSVVPVATAKPAAPTPTFPPVEIGPPPGDNAPPQPTVRQHRRRQTPVAVATAVPDKMIDPSRGEKWVRATPEELQYLHGKYEAWMLRVEAASARWVGNSTHENLLAYAAEIDAIRSENEAVEPPQIFARSHSMFTRGLTTLRRGLDAEIVGHDGSDDRAAGVKLLNDSVGIANREVEVRGVSTETRRPEW